LIYILFLYITYKIHARILILYSCQFRYGNVAMIFGRIRIQGTWDYFSHTVRKYKKLWFLIIYFVFQQSRGTCPTPIEHHRRRRSFLRLRDCAVSLEFDVNIRWCRTCSTRLKALVNLGRNRCCTHIYFFFQIFLVKDSQT
jgi:hypothetical protein